MVIYQTVDVKALPKELFALASATCKKLIMALLFIAAWVKSCEIKVGMMFSNFNQFLQLICFSWVSPLFVFQIMHSK